MLRFIQFQITLPDQSILVRWGKATEKSCNICGEAIGTAKHLLVGCRVLLNKGKYSLRHDKVLEIIREAVSLSVARAQRGITTTKISVEFIKAGSSNKSKLKPYSILDASPDCSLMMNTYKRQYKIPGDVCVSSSRPDLFLYSKQLRRIILVELTVPWETNIPKDHTFKLNKYYELCNELIRNNFLVNLYAVKVGARGKMGGFISHLWWGGDPDIVNDFSGLSRRDVYVVQKTWAMVYTNVVEIGMELFKRLFRVCPETKLFFKMIRDVPEEDFGKSHLFTAHVINLMSSLNLAITNLNQPEVSAALMNKLGESHGKRKIQEKHFLVLKGVMLSMLEELLKLDETTLNSWCKTVDFLYKHIFETLLIV